MEITPQYFCLLVGGAQAWASVGQPTLADRKKWLIQTTTKMGPIHQVLALMRRHKGLQVIFLFYNSITNAIFIYDDTKLTGYKKNKASLTFIVFL